MTTEAIKKFRDKSNDIILFDELNEVPLYIERDINLNNPGSVITYRLKSSNDDISFRVDMKKGEKWPIHSHDCNETILIYKGKLKDNITNFEISRLQTMYLPAFTDHEVIALEDSVFYVEFENPHK